VKKSMICENTEGLGITAKCDLLNIPRSTYYYEAKPLSELNQKLMRRIDELYTDWPFMGSRQMRDKLSREGYRTNRKRIQRLMRIMGIQAIYPKKWLSHPILEHKKYPYLLRGMKIDHPDQVWASDITYIRLRHGFAYLTVIMDWYSRYIISWRISTTIDNAFCVEALKESLSMGTPEYFNTDQGGQFTSKEFIDPLEKAQIKISMDSKGRAYDNIFVERFWRTLKYNDIYIHDYETVDDLWHGVRRFITFYNHEKPHQSLDKHTPYEVYCQGKTSQKAG
jgi:putative transposase